MGLQQDIVYLAIGWTLAGGVQAACDNASAERRAYFGDLHVHTSYSQDANWRMGNTRVTPDDAYAFARGARVGLPPFDSQGHSLRSAQLERPLDFLAVTDHAEALDQVRVCEDPDFDGPGAGMCRSGFGWRLFKDALSRVLPVQTLCPPGDARCAAAGLAVWQDIIAAAGKHHVDCEFTTFIGYEWSGTAGSSNLHRNVIFRNEAVLERPLSTRKVRTPEALWDALDAQCRDGIAGCEALTIPHNPNLSEGRMFSPLTVAGEPLSPMVAEQRVRYERLVELVQHKGESECYGGVGAEDELCRFEKLPYGSFLQKYFPILAEPPADDSRYVREALREGLRLERTLGQNPFVPGFIGGTDTHLGTGGDVAEGRYQGHHGARHIAGDGSLVQLPDRLEQNPGGLAVLYAQENTREALFAAMRRREAYATSGPRIQLRFFGGWDYPGDLCERVDLITRGYAQGVPMGGVLEGAAGGGRSPRFIVAAVADPGTAQAPGGLIQRLQVVKGWVGGQGASREQIYDVEGWAGGKATVDLDTCEVSGPGGKRLCTVWQDPEFDASQNAFYYSRVVENPSCRWQQRICATNRVNCADASSVPEGLEGCCDDSVPRLIQERAWSSPIWYQAPGG
ncbi:MAG: DUF3604 domain-containing protein [Parahaliea sp.]